MIRFVIRRVYLSPVRPSGRPDLSLFTIAALAFRRCTFYRLYLPVGADDWTGIIVHSWFAVLDSARIQRSSYYDVLQDRGIFMLGLLCC